MSPDQFEDRSPARPVGHGRLIAAGVIGACALGGGLGLWARPTSERPPARLAAAAAPAAARPQLEIVVDDTPAPIGRPLEVLPADIDLDAAAPRPAPEPPPELTSPVAHRPPSGLMKVDAPAMPAAVVPALETPEPPKEAPPPKLKPRPKPKATTPRKPEREVIHAKADTGPRKAKAGGPKTEKAALRPKRSKVKKSDTMRVAKADPARKTAQADKRRKLAENGKPAKSAKAKTKVVTAEAARTTAKPRPPKPQRADARAVKRQAAARNPSRAVAVQKAAGRAVTPKSAKPAPRGDGPLRVAGAKPCASPDPGEALVCGDRRLGARDRQMQRAYRDAEAAGVPASALRRQQARWLQARAAAARDAPWAVEDVYEARIAELNELSRATDN